MTTPCPTCRHPLAPLTSLEIQAAIDAVKAILPLPVDPDHDIFDPIRLKEPPKNAVKAYDAAVNPPPYPRILLVPFWRGGKEDLYKVYTVQISYAVDPTSGDCTASGRVTNEEIICRGRPKYSCVDDDKTNCIVRADPRVRAAVIKRVNASNKYGTVTLNDTNFNQYIYFDVSIDGRLDDCCEELDCQGPAKALKKKPRPHSFYLTPYYSDATFYANNSDNAPDDAITTAAGCGYILTAPNCKCTNPTDLSTCPTCAPTFPGSTAQYIQPVKGIYVLVDRRFNRIIKVVDTGDVYPVQNGTLEWRRVPTGEKPTTPFDPNNPTFVPDGSTPLLQPLAMDLPNGPSFTVDSCNLVQWQNWKFRIGFDANTGPVLYTGSFLDRTLPRGIDGVKNPFQYNPGTWRSVFYRLNLSELMTVYGTPDQLTRMRGYLDIGEYAPREFQVPLQLALDVPPYATLFDADVSLANEVDEYGISATITGAYALYEKEDDEIAWVHTDYSCDWTGRIQGRAARTLNLRYRYVVSNYDYIVTITFYQDGRIVCTVSASGSIEADGDKLGRVTKTENVDSGTLVAKYLNGVNHCHLWNWRVDLDIDGENNTIVENNVEIQPFSEENPCGNAWEEIGTVLCTEKESLRVQNSDTSRSWTVINPSSKLSTGLPRGYNVEMDPMPMHIIRQCSRIAKRETYLNTTFAATRYRTDEIYTSGTYPVERGHDTGLGAYIKNDESLVNKDVVIYATAGFAHAPIKENWPVMPPETRKVYLTPENFFEENPGLSINQYQWELCNGTQDASSNQPFPPPIPSV